MTEGTSSSDYKILFRSGVLAQLEAQARKRLHAQRPDLWARDVLDVTLWSSQVEVARSVVSNHNTMVAACHASGKSYLTAVLICWWIDTRPIGEARVLSTAPTTAQVRGIVWREVQKMHQLSRKRHAEYLEAVKHGRSTQGLPDHALPGYVTSAATWRSDEGVELGLGRTPPRGREGDAFQGVHAAGGVLAILDEGVGISAEMIGTMNNNTTGDGDRVLMIANPTNPQSEMGQIWNDPIRSANWNRITISLFDTPRFTDEHERLPEEVVTALVGKSYLERMRVDYGEDSANFKSRVLGQWALDSGMILFPEEVVQVGLEATVLPDENDPAPIHVGFDVARSEKGDFSYLMTAQEGWVYETQEWAQGSDGTWDWHDLPEPCRTERRGIRIRFLDRWRGLPFFPLHNGSGQRTTDIAANERVHAHMKDLDATQLRIDADGMGAIMHDAMIDVSDDSYDIIRILGNSPSPDRNAWYNLRAYSFSELARKMRLGLIDIQPDAPEHPLCQQLGALEYKFAAGMAESMLLLSKKELKEKGRKSPDVADSANYASMHIELDDGPRPGQVIEADLDVYAMETAGASSFYGNAW